MNRDKQNKQYCQHTLTTLISNDMISHKDSRSNKSNKSTSKDQHFYKQLFNYQENNKKNMKRFHTAENPLHEQQQLYNKNNEYNVNNDKIFKKPKSSNSFMNNRMFFPHQKVITINNMNKKQQVIISLDYDNKNKAKRINKSLNQKKIKNQVVSQNQVDSQISFFKKLNQQKKLKIMQIYRPKQSIKNKKRSNIIKSISSDKKYNIQSAINIKQKSQIQRQNYRYNTIDQYNQKQSNKQRSLYKYNIKSKSDNKYSAQNIYFDDTINKKINSNNNKSSLKKINVSSSESQRKSKSRSIKIMPLLSQIKQIQKPITLQVKKSKINSQLSIKSIKNQLTTMNSSQKKQILPKYLQFYDSFIQSSNIKNNEIINNNISQQTIEQTLKYVSLRRESPLVSTVKRTLITPSIIKQQQLVLNKQKQQDKNINISNSINNYNNSTNNNQKTNPNILLSHKYMPKLQALSNIMLNKQQNIKFIKTQQYTYYGQISQQNIPHGLGIIFYKSGKLYQGQLKNGTKSGYGYQLFKDGSFYIGQYNNNIKSGKGRFQWPSTNQIYDGQFLNNMKHGSGQWISPSISYFGQWKFNIIQGFGILIQGKQRYQGEFVNFNKHGHGTYRYQNGQLYTGEFKNNRLNGHGEYFWANGDSYKGTFVNNKRHGNGVLKLIKSNIIYKGQFMNDKKSGLGQQYYYLQNNNITQELYYYGNFQNDFKHGWGILKKNHNIIYQGYWINNQILQRSNTVIQSQTPNIIIQQTQQQLNQQISNRNVKKTYNNNNNKKNNNNSNTQSIHNTNTNKKISNFPKPKDAQLIRGRSRYMRMNNHYIKKSILNSSQKKLSLSKHKSTQKNQQKLQQNYRIY